MNETLQKTHKIQCRWIHDVHLSELSGCMFNDSLAVHCIRISAFTEHLNYLRSHLDENEMLKSVNYLMEKDTRRFIVARAVLKILLGKYLHKHPVDIEFYFERNLKPRVKQNGNSIHFNVSHSGDLIMIAFSKRPVGVDIEYMDEGFRFDKVMDVTFNPKELEFIQNSNNRSETFYLLWTRKEALLKATGKGIDNDLSVIPSLTGNHEISSDMSSSTEPWMVGSFGIGSEYIASLAFHPETEMRPVRVYKTGPEFLKI